MNNALINLYLNKSKPTDPSDPFTGRVADDVIGEKIISKKHKK